MFGSISGPEAQRRLPTRSVSRASLPGVTRQMAVSKKQTSFLFEAHAGRNHLCGTSRETDRQTDREGETEEERER